MMRNRLNRTVGEIGDDLGVPANRLHRWAKRLDADAVAKRNEQGETLEEENGQQRKENERLWMEKAILKKAAAFFAKDSEWRCAASSSRRRRASRSARFARPSASLAVDTVLVVQGFPGGHTPRTRARAV